MLSPSRLHPGELGSPVALEKGSDVARSKSGGGSGGGDGVDCSGKGRKGGEDPAETGERDRGGGPGERGRGWSPQTCCHQDEGRTAWPSHVHWRIQREGGDGPLVMGGCPLPTTAWCLNRVHLANPVSSTPVGEAGGRSRHDSAQCLFFMPSKSSQLLCEQPPSAAVEVGAEGGEV